MMSVIIPHWLEKQSDLNPDQIALEIPDGDSMTFSELREKSRGIASSMRINQIHENDHVAFLVDNQMEFPEFLHAISYVRAVAVLLNTRLTASELAFQLQDAQVTHLFVGNGLEETAEEAIRKTGLTNIKLHRIHSFECLSESGELNEEIDLEDVYTMMYTSGTTGRPKAVMHTYGNHWYSAVASALNLGVQSDDKWLLCLPMFHVGGFSVLMKSVIYGMTIQLMPKFDAEVINREVHHSKVTHISVVSLMLSKIMQSIGQTRYPEHFRCMLLGGGPVPESMLHQAHEKNIPVYQTYGMTETTSQIATLSPKNATTKIGSAGKALAPAELIIDSDEVGQIGEILVRGPMVTNGYYNHPPFKDRYFRTGDLGYKDQEGFLYVVDRVKDVIISGGENIYPAEIESILSGIEGVVEAGVTGMEHSVWGEVPVAFLVLKKGMEIDKETIQTICSQQLAKFKVPKDIFFVKGLPRNASNKLLRRKLLSMVDHSEDEYEH